MMDELMKIKLIWLW